MIRGLQAFCLCLASVALLTLSSGSALADKRVALIVGNANYLHINKLSNPTNDAPDLAEALKAVGFEVIIKTDLGKLEFDKALAEFARSAQGADTALFYYAGHGLQYQRQNYLLPTDIEVQDANDVEFQAIGIDRVLKAIDRAAGVKVLILDACRENPLAHEVAGRGLPGSEASRGLARIDRTEGLVIAYATAPDQVAQDGTGRNSPFTSALINRLKEPGVEIATMFRRVTNDVFERTNGRQRPEISVSLLREFYLNTAESDSMAWARIRNSDNPDDFVQFNRRFPNSFFTPDANLRVEILRRLAEERDRRQEEDRQRLERERAELERLRAERLERDRLAGEATRATQAERERQAQEEARQAEERRRRDDEQRAQTFATERERLERERAALDAERERLKQQEQARVAQSEREAAAQREAELRARIAAEDAARTAAEREAQERDRVNLAAAEQRRVEVCQSETAELARLESASDRSAIEALAKRAQCPAVLGAIDQALKNLAQRQDTLCQRESRELAGTDQRDVAAIQAFLARATCEEVRAVAQGRLDYARSVEQRQEAACKEEEALFDRMRNAGTNARADLTKLEKTLTCERLRPRLVASLRDLSPDAPALQQPVIAANTPELVRAAKVELRRAGCFAGSVDNGDLTPETRRALERFVQLASLGAAPHDVTQSLIDQLKAKTGRICPLVCPAREVERNGRCVLKTCRRGERLDEDGDCVAQAPRQVVHHRTPVERPHVAPQPHRTPPAQVTRQRGCFSFNGRQYCE